MKLLMHICCGPCVIYPLKELRTQGHEVDGIFYNPNIHPYQEYERRLQTLDDYANKAHLKVVYPEGYPLEEFLRELIFRESERCGYCLSLRLKYAAERALSGQYDGFTSTLLHSKYQKHELIRSIAENISKQMGIYFYYQDFRRGWMEGVEISKNLEMYRQKYCGCIYSEKDRFFKP